VFFFKSWEETDRVSPKLDHFPGLKPYNNFPAQKKKHNNKG